jgi:hypothetical protein
MQHHFVVEITSRGSGDTLLEEADIVDWVLVGTKCAGWEETYR